MNHSSIFQLGNLNSPFGNWTQHTQSQQQARLMHDRDHTALQDAKPLSGGLNFADEESRTVFDEVYRLANETFKAKLDALKNSDVIYYIDVNVNKFIISGANNRQIGEVAYEFHVNPTADRVMIQVRRDVAFKAFTLADELTGAYQFQEGKLGFVLTSKGVVDTIGYDMQDEIETKIHSFEIAQATLKEIQEQNSNAQLSDQYAAFEPYYRKGNYEDFFKETSYGKNYQFVYNEPTPGSGGYSLDIWKAQVFTQGAFDAVAFRANVTKGANNNDSILNPGGQNAVSVRWSESPHLLTD